MTTESVQDPRFPRKDMKSPCDTLNYILRHIPEAFVLSEYHPLDHMLQEQQRFLQKTSGTEQGA